MSMYAVDGEILNGIAHAIQSKTGSDEPMTVAAMASAIEGISGGGTTTPLTAAGVARPNGKILTLTGTPSRKCVGFIASTALGKSEIQTGVFYVRATLAYNSDIMSVQYILKKSDESLSYVNAGTFTQYAESVSFEIRRTENFIDNDFTIVAIFSGEDII